jgi:FecR protein
VCFPGSIFGHEPFSPVTNDTGRIHHRQAESGFQLTASGEGATLYLMKTINIGEHVEFRLRALQVLTAVFLLTTTAAFATDGVIEYIDGDVTVVGPSGIFDAEFGMPVAEGDEVVTGADGIAVVRLNDRSQVKLRENTRIQIDSVSEQAAVTLNSGGVFARVARQTTGAAARAIGFEIRTPSVVAGVRGTEFFVAYGRTIEDEPDLWLCVNEGAVEVAVPTTGQSTLVEEGEGINILGGLRATEPRFFPWTRDLNWGFDPAAGDIADDTDLDGAYADLLDQDYD